MKPVCGKEKYTFGYIDILQRDNICVNKNEWVKLANMNTADESHLQFALRLSSC